jgi:hypothetical protein
MQSTNPEKVKKLWAEVRELNQQLAAVHREIHRVELGLPEPFDFDKDWVPPYLRIGTCIPLRTM